MWFNSKQREEPYLDLTSPALLLIEEVPSGTGRQVVLVAAALLIGNCMAASLGSTLATSSLDVGAVGLFVHADYQGRGVGTTLMETLLDLADHWLPVPEGTSSIKSNAGDVKSR